MSMDRRYRLLKSTIDGGDITGFGISLQRKSDAAIAGFVGSRSPNTNGFGLYNDGGVTSAVEADVNTVRLSTNSLARLTIDSSGFTGLGRLPISGHQFAAQGTSTGGQIVIEAVDSGGNAAIYLRPSIGGINLISSNFEVSGPYLPLCLSSRETSTDFQLGLVGGVTIGNPASGSPLSVFQSGDGSGGLIITDNGLGADGRCVIDIRANKTSSKNYTIGVDTLGGTSKVFEIRDVTRGAVPFQISPNGNFLFSATASGIGLEVNNGANQPVKFTTSSGSPWGIELFRSDLAFSTKVFNDGNGWYFEHTPKFAGTAFQTRHVTALTNGSGASAGTLTNAPAAGNPTKWISIDDAGTTRKIPCW